MPPALHPRSRQTFSLFTATLAVSFLVVGLPHVLPCPVPHIAYADSDNPGDARSTRQRRERDSSGEDDISQRKQTSHQRHQQKQQTRLRPQRQQPVESGSHDVKRSESIAEVAEDERERRSDPSINRRRECPVPKPGGLIGQVMGFREKERQKSSIPPVIEIQPRRQKGEGKEAVSTDGSE